MTTTRFTKEQLIAKLQHRLTVAAKYPDVEEAELDAAIFQIALASLTAEPALYAAEETLAYAKMGELHLTCLSEPMGDAVIPLYTAPPASVVPEKMSYQDGVVFVLNNGMSSIERGTVARRAWNACRAAMLQGAGGKPELTVWYGAMPETNGKTNWTAMLHRKGQHPWEGITIDCSEYPDRVRYEADRMRHLIGELADEPDILAYDADAHSGYVEPVSNRDELPVIGWLRSDYNIDDKRDPNAPLFMLGRNDPSETWGVKYIPLTGNYPAVRKREQVRREHAEWSDATFGNVGPVGPLKHLSKEALEAAANPEDPLEWADMQFLLWDAQRRMGLSDDFITRAMIEKLEINRSRQWPEPKDGEPRLHIKEAGNSPVIPDCWCHTCRPVTMGDMRFVVCPECGNKRCPHTNDHNNACTGSNEPGQEGSAYPAAPQQGV